MPEHGMLQSKSTNSFQFSVVVTVAQWKDSSDGEPPSDVGGEGAETGLGVGSGVGRLVIVKGFGVGSGVG